MIPDFGKHALYIWLCYGAALVALGGLWLSTWLEHKRLAKRIDAMRQSLRHPPANEGEA